MFIEKKRKAKAFFSRWLKIKDDIFFVKHFFSKKNSIRNKYHSYIEKECEIKFWLHILNQHEKLSWVGYITIFSRTIWVVLLNMIMVAKMDYTVNSRRQSCKTIEKSLRIFLKLYQNILSKTLFFLNEINSNNNKFYIFSKYLR